MRLVLVTGGARSGKSRWAVDHAERLGGDDVTFVATGRPTDEEMSRRIARHRAERPPAWSTVEEPLRVGEAVLEADTDVVLLDCVTIWVSNLLEELRFADEDVCRRGTIDAVAALVTTLGRSAGTLIAVTNEVGLGVVPPTRRGRWYRDALGEANRRLADEADSVVLLVSGQPLELKKAPSGP